MNLIKGAFNNDLLDRLIFAVLKFPLHLDHKKMNEALFESDFRTISVLRKFAWKQLFDYVRPVNFLDLKNEVERSLYQIQGNEFYNFQNH
jgi:hypothetical protein